MASFPQTTYGLQPALGFSGDLDRKAPHRTLTMKNTEATASIPFGVAVKRKAAAATDMDAVLPAAETDTVLGFVVREQTYSLKYTNQDGDAFGQLDDKGLMVGTLFTVAVMGRMLVTVRTGCTAGQGVWIRAVAAGVEVLGAPENADDGTDMIDATKQAHFETTASANGLAWVAFDFTNRP